MYQSSGLVLESGSNTDSPLTRVLRQKDASRVGLGILVSIVKEPTDEREVASIDIGDKRNQKAERPLKPFQSPSNF